MAGERNLARRRLSSALALAAAALVALPALGLTAAAATPAASGSFDGSSGYATLNRPGARHTTLLASETAAESTVRLSFRADRAATGKGQAMIVLVRSTTGGPAYRARLQLLSDGSLKVAITRLETGRFRIVAGPLVVPDVTWSPGVEIAARVTVSGASAAPLAVTVWKASSTEPAVPQLEASDQPALGGPVAVRLRFGLSSTATNAPVRFDYRDVSVAPTGSTEPPPAPPESPPPAPEPDFPPDSYFVAPDGNDADAGTVERPWRTAQRAADTVAAGATVFLRAGTYGPFVMRRSGTAAAPIRFTSYPSETATVDGRGQVEYTIRLSAVRYVELSGLTVTGGYAERHNGGGVLVEGSAYVTVRDNIVRDNKAFGIRSQGSTYVTVEANDVTGNAVGIHIGAAGEGTVVADNDVHDNTQMMVNTADVRGDDVGAGGITLVKTVGHVVVRDNRVWGNRAPSYDYGYDGSAFEIYAARNWEFTGNTAWDNRVVFETGTDADRTPCSNGRFTRNTAFGPAAVDVSRGVVLRCAEDALIANNTFVGLQDFVFMLQHRVGTYGGSIEGLRIVNNVVSVSNAKTYSIDSAIPTSVVFEANVAHNTGTGYLATMVGNGATRSLDVFRQWTGQEHLGLAADPLFVDPSARDYRLRSESPAIDSALVIEGVTDSFAGDGPDRGSHESSR